MTPLDKEIIDTEAALRTTNHYPNYETVEPLYCSADTLTVGAGRNGLDMLPEVSRIVLRVGDLQIANLVESRWLKKKRYGIPQNWWHLIVDSQVRYFTGPYRTTKKRCLADLEQFVCRPVVISKQPQKMKWCIKARPFENTWFLMLGRHQLARLRWNSYGSVTVDEFDLPRSIKCDANDAHEAAKLVIETVTQGLAEVTFDLPLADSLKRWGFTY